MTKHVILFPVFFLSLLSSSLAQNIEESLFHLPDVIFEPTNDSDELPKEYLLKIKQPIDHQNPEKGYFYQKAYLLHQDFDQPTVIITQGYNLGRNRAYELTEMLDANQINVEHRYFGESIPEGEFGYEYLTLEQACADLHRINEIFRKMYSGKWMSTGISKGGATTIFYRYFYPEDVDVSVPYVAPINIAFEEPRIYTFLDTIGSDQCRADILAFQKRVLKDREAMLSLLKFYSLGAGYAFEYLNMEEAFEYTVLEYPFSFWQYGHDCTAIPEKGSSAEENLEYLLGVSDIGFFSDGPMDAYASHYYQSATQMGYYGYETEDFKGLLKALPLSPHPHAAFMPEKMPFEFDGSLLEDINEWLPVNGDRFIYINGALDTWSASAVPPNEAADALWFFMEGKHHGNARIRNMEETDKQLIEQTLERWLQE